MKQTINFQFKKCENERTKHFIDSKAFIEY